MSNHGWIRLKTRLLNVHVKSWLNTLKDKVAKCTYQIMVESAQRLGCEMYISNHGWIRLKTRLLNVHVKSWLNTHKDKVAKCTCQIMVEYA